MFDPVTVGVGLVWLGCYFTLLGFAFAFVASDLSFKVVVCEFGWLVGLICVVFGFSFLWCWFVIAVGLFDFGLVLVVCEVGLVDLIWCP